MVGCSRQVPDSGIVVGKYYLGEEKGEGVSIIKGNCGIDFNKLALVCERYRETYVDLSPETWVIRIKICREELLSRPPCTQSDVYVKEDVFSETQLGDKVNLDIGIFERVNFRKVTDRKRMSNRDYSFKFF